MSNTMEIRINNNGEYIPATLEVVDGVMIVSPKEEKVDVSQFKDGDVVTNIEGVVIIYRGITTYGYCGSFVSLDHYNQLIPHYKSYLTDCIRLATEEEKKKLFDALEKEGLTWDAEKKELVKLKWKPKIGDKYNYPIYNITDEGMYYGSATTTYTYSLFDKRLIKQNLAFKTKEECEAYCKRLNKAIEGVKP